MQAPVPCLLLGLGGRRRALGGGLLGRARGRRIGRPGRRALARLEERDGRVPALAAVAALFACAAPRAHARAHEVRAADRAAARAGARRLDFACMKYIRVVGRKQ